MSEISAGKVPIIESVGVAYKYLAANWQRWIPACLLLGAASGWYQMQVVRTEMDAANGVNSNMIAFGVFCIFMLVNIVVGVAIYRHVLRDEYFPPIGLSFGIDEMRVLGVTFSLALLFGILGFFIVLIFAVAASILVASNGLDAELASTNPELFLEQFFAALGTGNGPILAILGILIFAGMFFAGVRLTFVTAATVAERRMMVFQTWSFAKGNFWRIVGAVLVTVLPLALVGGIIISIFQLVIVGGTDVKDMIAASLPQLFIVSAIEGFINAIVSIASIALIAYLYKGLRPSDEELEALNSKAS